jgi:hypothetical protein
MRVKLEKEVIGIREKVVEIKCDVCGGIIQTEEEIDCVVRKGGYYYQITTGHSDWGMDSIESIEYADLCCDKCMFEYITKYVEETDSDTARFEFEREPI